MQITLRLKRNFLICLNLSILIFSTADAEDINDRFGKPNIIIILADDQGWGDLSYNGNTVVSTPSIDRLGKEGASFERFYVSPVCSPTRAELLTGRYHIRTGVYDVSEGGEMMNLDEKTIAEVFKEAGYATAAFGKWHNGMQYPYHPNGRGFDEFYGFCSGHWGNYFDAQLEHNGEIVTGKGYMPDDLTNKAITFMESTKNSPFFVYIPYNTPHSPMQVPDRWYNKFRNIELLQPEQNSEKEDIMHTRAALAMSENLDWNVGRIMQFLKDRNLEENTIVVYLSDNGPNGVRWNGNMKGVKGSTDEGGLRSPLFIYWKEKIKQGVKISKISGAIDLLPTLADLAGIMIKIDKKLDGRSLVSLINNNLEQWDDRYIFSHWNGRISVRSQNYRLDDQGMLFNMKNDPGQTKNISAEQPQEKEMLMKAKNEWEKDVFTEDFKKQRLFPIGHPDFLYTQMPARDGEPHGNIKRSNKYPNCSFFTNWTSLEDKIIWPVEVLSSGNFEVDLYYTCPISDVGSIFQLSIGKNSLTSKITEPHDPPLRGMENDRIERMESYVKDFKKVNIGTIHLEKGKGELTLKALKIPGKQVMDFRMMMFRRVE